MLESIRIVLCQTSHPGNIGAAARAMKNMGLRQLTLVAPEQFPHAVATERASGADDILAHAQVVGSLEEAIADCQWIYGTSCRQREFPWPQQTPAQAANHILQQLPAKVAIVFGPERAGLLNEHLQLCDFHIAIPTHPDYASLNLSQAVQVISYEIYQHWLAHQEQRPVAEPDVLVEKATQSEVTALLEHFEQAALKLGFFDPQNPKKLKVRMQRLFAKAQLEKEEVNILRGFFKFVLQKVR